DLHDGLGDAELVDPAPHHPLGALDGVGAVGDRTLRLVHLEGEVNAALEVETEVDGNAPDRGVLHQSGGGVTHALRVAGRDQRPDAEGEQDPDGDQAWANGSHRVPTG